MVRWATTKDIPAANAKSDPWFSKSFTLRLINSETAIAPMVGMASKKLNFAAASRPIPKKSAAEIVMPDLEVPGIKAKHCDSPITNACLAEIE